MLSLDGACKTEAALLGKAESLWRTGTGLMHLELRKSAPCRSLMEPADGAKTTRLVPKSVATFSFHRKRRICGDVCIIVLATVYIKLI